MAPAPEDRSEGPTRPPQDAAFGGAAQRRGSQTQSWVTEGHWHVTFRCEVTALVPLGPPWAQPFISSALQNAISS